MKTKNLALLTALILAISSIVAADGTVEEVSFFSPTLGSDRAALVYLPEGYEDSASSYPVIYLMTEWLDEKTGRIERRDEHSDKGATMRLDGRQFELVDDRPRDAFLGPTVFENVTPEMAIAQEEIFGPVANMMVASTLDAAIDMIHGNPFGNAASIFTGKGKWAREFKYRVECGNIGINIGVAAPMAFFPFSGWKDSFFGTMHGQSMDAVEFFTQKKVVVERWPKEWARKF